MNSIINELLKDVPDYKQFLTLEELDASTRKLAEEHPDCVSMFELGKTTEGRSILALKIGSGSKNALFFGCPHPNEPIGTMMLEHFTKVLAEKKQILQALDYTFYIVKAWDADGLVRNEGWLKGPYTLYNYSRNFFRPASDMQVDWTFPIDYKSLHFHNVMPETQALKELIDEIRPVFTYALHNSGFGGVYWYVTEDVPELYPQLREAVERQGIPLHLGEPESPAITVLAPAVLLAEGIESEYDYFERFGAKDITKPRVVGKILQHKCKMGRFEANNGGDEYADSISKTLKDEHGYSCNITHKKAPTTQGKAARIEQYAPDIKRYYFRDRSCRSPEYNKFMDEMTGFSFTSKNLHDDAADSMAMLADYDTRGVKSVSATQRPF